MTTSREIRDPETKLESLQKFPRADVTWHLQGSRHRVSDQPNSWTFRRRRDTTCMAAEMVAMPRLPGCTAELVGAHTCQWAVEPVY